MRDWSRYVREHLPLPDMKGERDERIIAELGAQLEEFYLEALGRGASEQEADAYVREQVTDWEGLAADILRSDRSDTVPGVERWVERSEQRVRQKGKLGGVLADLGQDVRYSLRTLRRSPGFLAVSVVVLGLGIGATTAIFSVLKAVVLRPLPYPDPDRLVMVWQSNTEVPTTNPLSVPDYFDWREQNESLEEWGVFTVRKVNLSAGDLPERVQGAYCTVGLMKAISIEPVLGRFFYEQEEQPGNARVVLISNDLWEERFAAEPSAIGASLRINGESYAVVGIMPKGYEFPLPWYAWEQPDVWLPLALSRDEGRRDSHWLFGIGRLSENVSIERAEAEFRAIAAGLAEEYPNTNSQVTARLVPLLEQMVGWVSDSLWILLGAVGFVLLIACANISSLLLARGANRQHEMAIRTSLGAGRERLVRQLITETLILASLGGVAGVLLAAWSMGVLRGVIPSYIPRIGGLQIDGSVLVFSLGVTLIAGMVFGLTPAFVTSGMSPMRALREGGRSQTLSRRQTRFLGALIVLQFGLALVLANGAFLMLKSLLNATGSPELSEPERALVAEMSLQGPDYESVEQRTAFWDRFLERVDALPAVEAVGVTTQLPLFGGSSGHILVDEEEFDPAAQKPLIMFSWATGDYFRAAGIPLLYGRTLQDEDGQGDQIGVVVNRALAERYWPGENAVGKRLRGNSSPPWFDATIVGVVDNVRQWGLEAQVLREIYFPFNLNTRPEKYVVVRSALDPLSLVPSIRQELGRIDSDLPLSGIRGMEQLYAASAAGRRSFTTLTGLFALLALVLVAAGTYGVMSFFVSQRRQEIGIRVAFGAENKQILKLVFWRAFRLALFGIVIGVAGAFGTSRIVGSMLYGIRPVHPAYILAVVTTLALIALLAAAVPALRASRVDPVRALESV